MKKIKYIVLASALFALGSCSEADYLLFDDIDRVQLYDIDPYYKTKVDIRYNFIYLNDPSVTQDTVYITVNTIGYPKDRPRRVAFRQIPEYTLEIVSDDKGNITDTIYHEVLEKGVPGVHYVPMDDPDLQQHLVVPAGAVTAQIPVILLRDASLEETEMRVRLELVATEDFALGENSHLAQTIYISDAYSRPNNWTTIVTNNNLGKYSKTKHQLIQKVTGILVSDDFITKANADPPLYTYVKLTTWQYVQAFNSDPENILSGKAPMRDEDGALITFPYV